MSEPSSTGLVAFGEFVRGPELPEEIRAEHPGWVVDVAWQSAEEVRTYRLTGPHGLVRYAKVAEQGRYPSIPDEVARLHWAREHLAVPEVIGQGSESGVEWFLTKALPGRDATDPMWKSDPERLVGALARGLRSFHETPLDGCPFDFSLDIALEHARRRLAEGWFVAEEDFHPEFSHLTEVEAVDLLEATRPSTEARVVCHGDYCAPNILIDGWQPTGFVDLGELGVADRWWDLAVATWSVEWNFGRGHQSTFLSEYGVELDDDRLAFYRLLYDVVS